MKTKTFTLPPLPAPYELYSGTYTLQEMEPGNWAGFNEGGIHISFLKQDPTTGNWSLVVGEDAVAVYSVPESAS